MFSNIDFDKLRVRKVNFSKEFPGNALANKRVGTNAVFDANILNLSAFMSVFNILPPTSITTVHSIACSNDLAVDETAKSPTTTAAVCNQKCAPLCSVLARDRSIKVPRGERTSLHHCQTPTPPPPPEITRNRIVFYELQPRRTSFASEGLGVQSAAEGLNSSDNVEWYLSELNYIVVSLYSSSTTPADITALQLPPPLPKTSVCLGLPSSGTPVREPILFRLLFSFHAVPSWEKNPALYQTICKIDIAMCLISLFIRRTNPMRVIEVNLEWRRNEMAGETGDPSENPPTNGIVRHHYHLRKPGSPWWKASVLIAQPPWYQVLMDNTHLHITTTTHRHAQILEKGPRLQAPFITWPTLWLPDTRVFAVNRYWRQPVSDDAGRGSTIAERRNAKWWESGDPRENSLTNAIIRQMRRSRSGPAGNFETDSPWWDVSVPAAGHGGVVVKLPASRLGEPGLIPSEIVPGFPHGKIVEDDVADRRVFSGYSRFPRPFIPTLLHTHLVSPSSALRTSSLRAPQISPLHEGCTLMNSARGKKARSFRRGRLEALTESEPVDLRMKAPPASLNVCPVLSCWKEGVCSERSRDCPSSAFGQGLDLEGSFTSPRGKCVGFWGLLDGEGVHGAYFPVPWTVNRPISTDLALRASRADRITSCRSASSTGTMRGGICGQGLVVRNRSQHNALSFSVTQPPSWIWVTLTHDIDLALMLSYYAVVRRQQCSPIGLTRPEPRPQPYRTSLGRIGSPGEARQARPKPIAQLVDGCRGMAPNPECSAPSSNVSNAVKGTMLFENFSACLELISRQLHNRSYLPRGAISLSLSKRAKRIRHEGVLTKDKWKKRSEAKRQSSAVVFAASNTLRRNEEKKKGGLREIDSAPLGRGLVMVADSPPQPHRGGGGAGGGVFLYSRLKGAMVAERLARSPPTKANRFQYSVGSPDFRKGKSCRTMPLVSGSSRRSPVFLTPSFQRRSIFTSITLVGSQDLAGLKGLINDETAVIYCSHELATPAESATASGCRVQERPKRENNCRTWLSPTWVIVPPRRALAGRAMGLGLRGDLQVASISPAPLRHQGDDHPLQSGLSQYWWGGGETQSCWPSHKCGRQVKAVNDSLLPLRMFVRRRISCRAVLLSFSYRTVRDGLQTTQREEIRISRRLPGIEPFSRI
ncbi:hypothetical protein PR048_027851 [Dryococelus australis]|uniref:Uncharacterized protein n=1 Tax=Dryococelus australis TaxID=614101 RepID=A0ABQ9GHL1_9NEOP|nr:hypothetical protein PR048_027851 [Dryococelus australis]